MLHVHIVFAILGKVSPPSRFDCMIVAPERCHTLSMNTSEHWLELFAVTILDKSNVLRVHTIAGEQICFFDNDQERHMYRNALCTYL